MLDLKTYLQLPERQRLYSEGMALLHRHGLPQYSAEYNLLNIGPMGNNRHKLFAILKKLQETPAIARPVLVEIADNRLPVDDLKPKSKIELELMLKLRKLKQQRAQCSQQFHSCDTDQQRAEVCDLIDKATAAIRKAEKELHHLQRFGALPKNEIENKPIPTDLEELRLELARVDSHIGKVERRLDYLLELPDTHVKKKTLPATEEKCRSLYIRQRAIKRAIRKLTNPTRKKTKT
jgi:hypothetical protein